MQLLITLVEKQINALAPLITQNEIFIDDLNKNYDRKVKSKSIETLKMFFFTKSSLYYNKNYINNLYLHSGNMLLVIYNNLLNKLSPNFRYTWNFLTRPECKVCNMRHTLGYINILQYLHPKGTLFGRNFCRTLKKLKFLYLLGADTETTYTNL